MYTAYHPDVERCADLGIYRGHLETILLEGEKIGKLRLISGILTLLEAEKIAIPVMKDRIQIPTYLVEMGVLEEEAGEYSLVPGQYQAVKVGLECIARGYLEQVLPSEKSETEQDIVAGLEVVTERRTPKPSREQIRAAVTYLNERAVLYNQGGKLKLEEGNYNAIRRYLNNPPLK